MNKSVIVTGGAIRIGREICLKLSEEGYNIAIHYRSSEDDARELQEEIQSAGGSACTIQCDLNDSASVKGLIKNASDSLGDVVGVVNNASLFVLDRIEDVSEEDEEVGDDFESLYKGEISKSGVPILPSKRARKIPEKIQVSKDDLAELTNTPEVQAEESETGEVSLDQMSEEENNEAATEESETSNS